jgi:predicted N-formylglutamate amidohydrolase
MSDPSHRTLLSPGDPPPFGLVNACGSSPFLLTGDHTGNAVPGKLAMLGLTSDTLARHIGWDIGIGALGRHLARQLDAVFVFQPYSRLVIDCNRDPRSRTAILSESDGIAVPGNAGLSPAEVHARIDEIHRPYHRAIEREIARRDACGQPTVVIALHSFTPLLAGLERPWQIGVLHAGHADRFAIRLLQALRMRDGLVVGDNQPYRLDETDYSIPRHCFAPDRPYAELEIRQDELFRPDDVTKWAEFLAETFGAAK